MPQLEQDIEGLVKLLMSCPKAARHSILGFALSRAQAEARLDDGAGVWADRAREILATWVALEAADLV